MHEYIVTKSRHLPVDVKRRIKQVAKKGLWEEERLYADIYFTYKLIS